MSREKNEPKEQPTLLDLMKVRNKSDGAGTMIKASQVPSPRLMPTGSFLLDYAMLGGLPQHMNMFVGKHRSGKSTMLYKVISQAQVKYPDKNALLLDIEHTFDPAWGELHGIDLDRLVVCCPNTGEDAMDILKDSVLLSDVSIVGLDAIASMSPADEITDSTSDQKVGVIARLLGRGIRPMFANIAMAQRAGNYPTVVFCNQWRVKPGVMFGSPEEISGGRLAKHASAVLLDFSSKEVYPKEDGGVALGKTKEPQGNMIKFSIIDGAKIPTAVRSGEFYMNKDHTDARLKAGQIDEVKIVAAYARKHSLILGEKVYSFVGLPDLKLSGFDNLVLWLDQNPDFLTYLKIKTIVKQRIAMKLPPFPPDNYLLRPCPEFIDEIVDRYKIGVKDVYNKESRQGKEISGAKKVKKAGEGNSKSD